MLKSPIPLQCLGMQKTVFPLKSSHSSSIQFALTALSNHIFEPWDDGDDDDNATVLNGIWKRLFHHRIPI